MSIYKDSFSRNIGLVTEAEQEILRQSCVAIAGLGGMGGAYAYTMARLGIGRYHISDFDVFEPVNFNRQAGATLENIGRKKTDVIKEMILSINPEAQVTVFEGGLSDKNIEPFLNDANLVLDGLDFFVLPVRRMMFSAAEKKNLHVVTSGPVGMTATLHVFGPGAMKFEEYFDFASCKNSDEELAAFLVGVAPALLHVGQADFSKLNFRKRQAPSLGTSIQLCAGLAGTEALNILLKRRTPFLAPRYLQFDASHLRLAKRRLWFGNRSPLQRVKRRALLRLLAKLQVA